MKVSFFLCVNTSHPIRGFISTIHHTIHHHAQKTQCSCNAAARLHRHIPCMHYRHPPSVSTEARTEARTHRSTDTHRHRQTHRHTPSTSTIDARFPSHPIRGFTIHTIPSHPIHPRLHTQTHTETHRHTHRQTHARMHTRTHAHTHTRTHTRTHAHTQTYACTHSIEDGIEDGIRIGWNQNRMESESDGIENREVKPRALLSLYARFTFALQSLTLR